jgi:hypothetical protein
MERARTEGGAGVTILASVPSPIGSRAEARDLLAVALETERG